MRHLPQPDEIYRHMKGNRYQIITLARHTETEETLVVYQALYGEYGVFARPLSLFMEELSPEKYPDAGQRYRFELEEADACAEADEPGHAREQGGRPAEIDREDGFQLDPQVAEFLDADSHEERLNILAAIHGRVTDDMISTMAMAVDLEIPEGDTEERYEELKKCILTLEKYESNRLR